MAFLLRGAHVVDPQVGLDDVRDVLIDDKHVAEVGVGLEPPADAEVIDATGKYLVPGLVDMHVHFRDPGFEYKETIETGARAATHGGFTDVATMPNTDPVTDTGAEIRYQLDHCAPIHRRTAPCPRRREHVPDQLPDLVRDDISRHDSRITRRLHTHI